MLVDAILKLLGSGLAIWELKEKDKYVKKYQEILERKRDYDNTPDNKKDDLVYDNIEFELYVLTTSLSDSLKR